MFAAISPQEQEGEDTTVVGVQPGASSGQHSGGSGQRDGANQHWSKMKSGRGGGGGQQMTNTVLQAEQARIGSGFCFAHFCYDAKAKWCKAHCNWLGTRRPKRINTVATGQLIHMLIKTTTGDSLWTRVHYATSSHTSLLYLPQASEWVSSFNAGENTLYTVQLLFQDQNFSWKFLLANVAFPVLGVDFLRFCKLVIEQCNHALLDSVGRRLAGPGEAQPAHGHSGGWHNAAVLPYLGDLHSGSRRWRPSLQQLFTPHTARPASSRAVPSSCTPHRWTSQCQISSLFFLRQGPRWPTFTCWKSFRQWSARPSCYHRSTMTLYFTLSLRGPPLLQSSKNCTARNWGQ
jgi:hypothetical protein